MLMQFCSEYKILNKFIKVIFIYLEKLPNIVLVFLYLQENNGSYSVSQYIEQCNLMSQSFHCFHEM